MKEITVGDRYVEDLKPDLAKYEEQLRLLNSQIHKVDRQLGREQRLTDRAYRKNTEVKRGMRWIRRYDKHLIKSHQLQREYKQLVDQRNSTRRYVMQLREVIENHPVISQNGRSA